LNFFEIEVIPVNVLLVVLLVFVNQLHFYLFHNKLNGCVNNSIN